MTRSCLEAFPAAPADESLAAITHSTSSGFTPYSCWTIPRIQVSEVDENPGVAIFFPRRCSGLSMPRSVWMKMLLWRNARSGNTGIKV